MADRSSRRKLAAILSADVVGYSRLMAADEAATVETLKAYRDIIVRLVARHGGRVVNAPGDALLAEFPSAVEAVQAAIEIQQSVEGHNIELEADRRMQFRIGVNLGDVIEESDGTIYGDGVNIAARMEALAEGGGATASPQPSTTPSRASFPSDSIFWASTRSRTLQSRSVSTACAPSPSHRRRVLGRSAACNGRSPWQALALILLLKALPARGDGHLLRFRRYRKPFWAADFRSPTTRPSLFCPLTT